MDKTNYEKIGMTTRDFIYDFEYGQNTETYSPIFEIIVNDSDNYAIIKTYYVPEADEDENSEEKVEVYFILSYDDKRAHALDHGFTGFKSLKENMEKYGKSWKTIYRN